MDIGIKKPDYVIGEDSFSAKLAESLGSRHRLVRHEYYPDGEPSPRILADYGELEGKHVVFVHRVSQLPNRDKICRGLHNAERIVGNLKYMFNANEIDVLMPYYLFSRQDKDARSSNDLMVRERDHGKDIGYEFVARALKAQGAERIITLTPHFHRGIDGEYDVIGVCGIDVVCICGVNALARYAKGLIEDGRMNEKGLIIAPDEHSYGLAKKFADKIEADYKIEIMEKKRIDGKHVLRNGIVDMHKNDIVVIDDILSTLGTVETLIESVRNTNDVDIFAIHGVFPEEGLRRATSLVSSGKARRIVTTDSIDNDYARASILPDIKGLYL